MTGSVIFEVPGRPIPYSRPAFFNKRRLTPQKERTYREKVGWLARAAANGTYFNSARLKIDIDVYVDRRADVDNLAKAILDGLNGVLWRDDLQIDELNIRRIWENDKTKMKAVIAVAEL